MISVYPVWTDMTRTGTITHSDEAERTDGAWELVLAYVLLFVGMALLFVLLFLQSRPAALASIPCVLGTFAAVRRCVQR